MILNGIHYGEPVPGTQVLRHGRAPRESAKNRQARAWFECLACRGDNDTGIFFSARISDVREGRQVSCGCRSRETFKLHWQRRASNVPQEIKSLWFRLAHNRRRTKNGRLSRLSNWEIAAKFHVHRYLVDFCLAEVCESIRQKAARSYRQLKAWQRAWYAYATGIRGGLRESFTSRVSNRAIEESMFPASVPEPSDHTDTGSQRSYLYSSLHWSDRLRLEAAERAEQAATQARIQSEFRSLAAYSDWFRETLLDDEADVQIGYQPPKGWAPLNNHRLLAA